MMEQKIEELRQKLNEAIDIYGITSKKVLKLSCELDEVISEYYKSMKKD